MLKAFYLHDNQLSEGGEELITQWQTQGGHIWLDFYEEPAQQEAELLAKLAVCRINVAHRSDRALYRFQ